MRIVTERLSGAPIEARAVEIVERKGLGHPDSICDAVAEELSLALSRHYLERSGAILHHNVDKVLLFGGSARPRFGGGKLLAPLELFLCGRATAECEGTRVPVEELAVEGTRRWLRENLHALDAEAHVVVHPLVREGSAELTELFRRQQAAGACLANDTSCGVGYAPLSELESVVLRVEESLNDPGWKARHPETGEDVKVMGVRERDAIDLTVACAFVGRFVMDLAGYEAGKADVAAHARLVARAHTRREVRVRVNAADDPARESIYLTVTGTSAEGGDDGEAGRGNRANGLISPYRTMTMESVAGKNPVTHVGKLYNVLASLLAQDLVEGVPGVAEATCHLVSRIGQRVDDPQLVNLRLRCDDPELPASPRIEEMARARLAEAPTLWKQLVAGTVAVDRWPLRVRGAAR
jgi:S-adenosylmethionine synthetase